MLQQAIDLQEEGDELFELLDTLKDTDWGRSTPFKGWTVNQVIVHLHSSDRMAVLSLKDPQAFQECLARRAKAREHGENPDDDGLKKMRGRELFTEWRDYFNLMCTLLGEAIPEQRVKWVGPDMGVRMFTTARQMETWAHGQDIYDLLRRPRVCTDRIKNIAVIGVRTFGWTFANRHKEPPGPAPHIRLAAPSGAIWEWNEPNDKSRIEGLAVEFCHVVTQCRNIADCQLVVIGEVAKQWMAIAQCFAGPPKDPPLPGERSW